MASLWDDHTIHDLLDYWDTLAFRDER